MKSRLASIALAALALLLAAAAKPVLVPDISSRSVEIRYSFTGAQLLLFGAILYPGGRAPERPADIVVVLRGPVEPIVVREKQKIAGIWMNADSNRFRSAPSFYAVASSRPISDLVDERTAAIYELGLRNLQLSPGGGALPEKERRFEAGLLDLRNRQGLYAQYPDGVEISEGVLYRAPISIPSQVPVGTYTAETFLIDEGKVIAAATRDVAIGASGFERFVALAARRQLQILQAKLVDRRGALIDQLVDRPRRGDRVEGRRRAEADPADVHPDARHLALLAQDDALERPLDHDRDVGAGLGRPAVGIDDGAEQQQLGAGEAVADLDMALRDVGNETRLGLAEQQRRGQSESEGGEALHSICTV